MKPNTSRIFRLLSRLRREPNGEELIALAKGLAASGLFALAFALVAWAVRS